jgi:type I restriction enzyme R subunit
MSKNAIGKPERASQDRVIQLFQKELGYSYLGDWEDEVRTQPIEEDILKDCLLSRGYSAIQSQKAIDKLVKAATNLSTGLYEANKEVYHLLRYGVTVREELGQPKETVWLIDWKDVECNQFAVAEEVTVQGKHRKRPDIVVYVNGIALGVLELKSSKINVEEGIHQNLDNQKEEFIPKFFTAMQLVMAGNDTQGIRYGTIETREKYFVTWKEESDKAFDYILDKHISLLCEKSRLLELVHDFVVFDKGAKKLCRPNQYFGVKAAQSNVKNKQGGILWHTQGFDYGLAHQMDTRKCKR